VKVNVALLNAGLGNATNPPWGDQAFTPDDVIISAGHTGVFTYSDHGLGPPSSIVQVYASAMQSPGRRAKPNLAIVGEAPGDSGLLQNMSAQYVLRFGKPTLGWRVFWKAQGVTVAGTQGPALSGYVIVS